MPINEASVARIRRFASQYNATHGRPPSPFQISAMLQGEIEADIAKQQQGRALALQSRAIDINESQGQQRIGLMERELSNQEKGAKMSGYGTAGMIGLIGAKELGLAKPIGEGIMKGAGSLWNVGKGMGGGTGQAIPTAGTAINYWDTGLKTADAWGTAGTAGTIADTELGWTFAGDKVSSGSLLEDIWEGFGDWFSF